MCPFIVQTSVRNDSQREHWSRMRRALSFKTTMPPVTFHACPFNARHNVPSLIRYLPHVLHKSPSAWVVEVVVILSARNIFIPRLRNRHPDILAAFFLKHPQDAVRIVPHTPSTS